MNSEHTAINVCREETQGSAQLPAYTVIYASVEETCSSGLMLIEAMTEVEKMDLRLTARGPASAKCESCVQTCPQCLAPPAAKVHTRVQTRRILSFGGVLLM